MEKLSLLESLINEDFGLELAGDRWAHSSDHDSLVVDRLKQIFYWNSKGISGDVYSYLTLVRHWSHNDSKDYVRNKDYKTSFIYDIRNKDEVIVYPKLVDIFNENLNYVDKSYFYKRTITDETIHRFKLGYYDSFYMIPIYQDGLFKQFQMRKDVPVKTIRNYYRGVGGLLFNSDILKYTNEIIYVEGVTSCIVVNQNGLPCVSSNTGAEGFMTDWFPYFINQKNIYLCYDNDSAGLKGALRTAKILGENKCKIYTFSDFDEKGYDANDFFKEGGNSVQFMDLLKERSKYAYELCS